MEIGAQAREDIMEYQQLQQQLQMLLMQKQQMQMQISESKKADEELTAYTGTAYRFAGGILVEKNPGKLREELKSERETIEMRAGFLEKQEGKLIERLKMLETKLSKLQAGMTGGSAGASVGEGTSVGNSNSSGPSITKKGKGAA